WAVPGTGELCDACEAPVTNGQMAVADFASNATGPKPLLIHATCFQIWDAERPLLPPPGEGRGAGDDIGNSRSPRAEPRAVATPGEPRATVVVACTLAS